jgi:hypothetical protein
MALAITMQLAGFGGLWLAPRPPCSGACCAAPGLGELLLIMVIALDHLPDPRRAGALCALMQGRLHGGGYRPWVAARLHHASGDFAAAWQWQLGALVLMSLLVVRLNPRHYPGPWACPGAGHGCATAGHKPADPASTGLGGQKAQHRPWPVLCIRVREGLALSALLAPALPWPRFAGAGLPLPGALLPAPCWQPFARPALACGALLLEGLGTRHIGPPANLVIVAAPRFLPGRGAGRSRLGLGNLSPLAGFASEGVLNELEQLDQLVVGEIAPLPPAAP